MAEHPALSRVDHRPWPVPDGPWTWRQSWRDLLFAHWPVPVEALRHLVPEALTIETFDGTSWVGVVPFRMAGVMRRPLPDLPWISAFPELNLRLYVSLDGLPGVFFLSLDATNPLAVWSARTFFHLPYLRARIDLDEVDGVVHYDAFRLARPRGIRFRANYRPTGPVDESTPGTLEHWLTERYCLYACSPRGRLFRAEVHHVPWPLQPAEASIERNDLAQPHGFELDGPPALLHFSRRIDVVVWSPESIGRVQPAASGVER